MRPTSASLSNGSMGNKQYDSFIWHCYLCSGGAVLTVVELLEEAGLPPLCIAMAEEEDADRVVGEVLAEAVKVNTLDCKDDVHPLFCFVLHLN